MSDPVTGHFAPRRDSWLSRVRHRARRVPVVGPALLTVKARLDRTRFVGSGEFWEQHYSSGGLSGPGSYGQLADFKATVLNKFVMENDISGVVELGCGDGNQAALGKYRVYVGLDISPSAISICEKRFKGDGSKSFALYDPRTFRPSGVRQDMSISLDVLYHLIEDAVFETYLHHLFDTAIQFVAIYSSNAEFRRTNVFVRHRRFTPYVEKFFPEWELVSKVPNPYPFSGDPETGSLSEFFFYRRRAKQLDGFSP